MNTATRPRLGHVEMGYRFVGVQAVDDIIGRVAPRAAKNTDSRLAARVAAIASLGAAVIHFAVVPAHWQEWLPAGLFFVSIALFQFLWAPAVLTRPTTTRLVAGIAVNVGAAALWVLSRTSGAPYGPHAGEPELVQAAGLCALLLEIYVVMGAGWVWYRGHHAQPIPAFANVLVLLGGGAVIAAAATVGAVSGLQHNHHAAADDTHHHRAPAVDSTHPAAEPAHAELPTAATDPVHDGHGDHHAE